MTTGWWEQLLFVAAVTAALAPPLGRYLAATFRGGPAPLDRLFLPVENRVYRALGTDPGRSWTWRAYALAVLGFGMLSTLLLYGILRLQGVLPLNPAHAPGMSPYLSFNTAISFITGTNWQAYEGETQASYLAQMAGLVVAQFIAAGVGLAVALAVVRGIAGSGRTVGNFWGARSRSRAGRSPRWRSSSCSGRTAAASTAPAARTRSRTRPAFPTCSSCCLSSCCRSRSSSCSAPRGWR